MLPKYKDIVELIKKGSTIEAQEKIMELREAAIELQDEHRELKEKIRELEEKLKLKESVVWDKPYYWYGEGDDRQGPFCQRCYDSDGKLVRLQGGKNDKWYCHECKNPAPRQPRVARDTRYVAIRIRHTLGSQGPICTSLQSVYLLLSRLGGGDISAHRHGLTGSCSSTCQSSA